MSSTELADPYVFLFVAPVLLFNNKYLVLIVLAHGQLDISSIRRYGIYPTWIPVR